MFCCFFLPKAQILEIPWLCQETFLHHSIWAEGSNWKPLPGFGTKRILESCWIDVKGCELDDWPTGRAKDWASQWRSLSARSLESASRCCSHIFLHLKLDMAVKLTQGKEPPRPFLPLHSEINWRVKHRHTLTTALQWNCFWDIKQLLLRETGLYNNNYQIVSTEEVGA